MASIYNHEELQAWQLSEELREKIFEIIERPRVKRDGGFCDDIKRSARSAPANLAEGFYRYRPRDNGRFVHIAIGSLGETLNHLLDARKRRYITHDEHVALTRLAKRAKGASSAWLAYLESCPPDGPKRKEGGTEPKAPEPKNLEPKNPEPKNPEPKNPEPLNPDEPDPEP